MYNFNSLPNQNGRNIIVTGSNTGLGYETAKILAQKGATVIMACRDIKKATVAKKSIEKEVPDATLHVMQIDLSSLASVRAFAKEFHSTFNRLDVLINNAGVMIPPYTKTEDGFELQLGANYLGHFLLTGLLFDTIVKTPNSRIVSLSSIAHKQGNIHFNDLQFEKKYSAIEAYAQSKLACLIFAYELQRRLEKAGITHTISTAAHPGVSPTELSRHIPKWLYRISTLFFAPIFTHPASEGAKPTVLAAIGEAKGADYFGPTGFNEMKGEAGKAKSTIRSKDKDLGKKLWEVSEKLVGFSFL